MFVLRVLSCLIVFLAPISVWAQTAPQIKYLFPAGAQVGSDIEITVGGNYMPGPCHIWIDGEGLTTKDETTEGQLSLNVAANAEPGTRKIRIHTVQGGSTPQSFVIGSLPEIIESEVVQSTSISLPVTINGQLNPAGDIDKYPLSLRTGQTIVCSLAAASLGSPSDVVLQLHNAADQVVATNNDYHGVDPLLAYQCQTDGEYTLHVYNYNLGGGVNHIYRLTLTDGPFLDHAYPSALQANSKSEITLFGWNLAKGHSMPYAATATNSIHIVQLPKAANQLSLPVTEFSSILEREPNETVETANKVTVPHVIHGRFDQPGDIDTFSLSAVKGDRLVLEVHSDSLNFPADPVMTILNDKGATVREVDDVAPTRDPRYLWTVPADGDYQVVLKERAQRGGPRFIYQLHIVPPQPDVSLTLKGTEFAVVPGETLSLPVRVVRKDGFAGDLEVTAVDLPAGVTVEPQIHNVKSKPDVKLELKAAANAQFASGTFRITAKTIVPQKTEGKEEADNKEEAMPPLLRSAELSDLWLAVGPKVPFDLTLPKTIQEAPRLAAFPFPVTVTRDEGFDAPIRLVGVDRDVRGTVIPLTSTVAKGDTSGTLPLIIQAMAIEGTTHRCRVMGVTEITGPDGKDYSVFRVAAGNMSMGCQPNLLTLTSTPEVAAWKAGETIPVTVSIERRVTIGEVVVSLDPNTQIDGIEAAPVKIPAGRNTAVLNIKIAAGVALPPKVQLELQASSTRAGLPVGAVAPFVLVAP